MADAASSAADGLLGGQPYAARLARASVKAGYLHGLGENHQWKRRFFVLKPTTMLYYFGSDADEEPLGCVDVEAFTSVSCRDVEKDGRVTIELARAAPPGTDNAKPLIFSLRAPGEAEGYGWIDALKGSSYARLKEANEVMRQQCDDYAADISSLERAAAAASEAEAQAKRSSLAADARRQRVLDGVASIYERGCAQRNDAVKLVPGDDDALLAAVEALVDAHAHDLAEIQREAAAAVVQRADAGRHLAAELAEARQAARDAQADVQALRTANNGLRARHKLLVREVKKTRSAVAAGPPAAAGPPEAEEDAAPSDDALQGDDTSQEDAAPPAPEPAAPPADDAAARRAADARRAAFRADVRAALDLRVAQTAAAEFQRSGLSAKEDDDAVAGAPDERWLERDEDAPIAGLPGVQNLVYERPTIGINFEVRESALVVSGTTEAYDTTLAKPVAGSRLAALNGESCVGEAPEVVMGRLRNAPRPLELEFWSSGVGGAAAAGVGHSD
jgi:hypothetical protein